MIGKLFDDRYQIQEKLGSGGTAIVYKGRDTLLNRMVTVKILREEYAGNDEFVRRFRREAQAVASLSHGNIVGVYDVGFEENMHYIVMEFVEGQSLKEYIKQKGALPVQEAAAIMMQILDGISYAHEHGIVHRDIKPHNILLGKNGRAKVTDFGIAVGMTDMTQTYNTSSRIMGSVHYIAPEQVQGQPVTEKSDIYSAGVVFYEMLTGQLPFSGDTPISIAMQHVQGELILPHQLNTRVPMGLSYVVMRAMRKNPETRYENVKEMMEGIRGVTEGLNSIYVPRPEENLENTRRLRPPLPGGDIEPPRERQDPYRSTPHERAPSGDPQARDYRQDRNEPRRRISAMSIIMVVLLLAFAGTMVWAIGKLGTILGGTPSNEVVSNVMVPNVVGRDLADAQAKLRDLDLEPVVRTRKNDDAPFDQVIEQDVSLIEVKPGRTINLTVSDGPRLIEVPLIVGWKQTMAEVKLRSIGLKPAYLEEDYEEYSDDFLEGEIMRQDPKGGDMVQGGTAVILTVSLGPEPVPTKAPKVVEKTLDEATALLLEAVLEVGEVNYVESTVYNADIVIEQSPPGGSELNEGDSVDLTVSRGPGPQPITKTTPVYYSVPNDGINHMIRIVVSDEQGTREVFSENLSSNYLLQETVMYYGQGTVSVYDNDELKGQQQVQ